MKKKIQVLILGALVGLSATSHAVPTYDMWVSTGAPVLGLTGVNPCYQSTSGSTAISCSSSSGAIDNNYGLVIGATASASVTPGALHLGAETSIAPYGGANARAHGYFSESLTFIFPGAAPGSSGQLSGAFVIDGGLGATATGSSLATNVGLASLSMQGSFGGVNVGTQGSNMFSTAAGQSGSPFSAIIPVTWNFTVGPNGQVLGSFSVMGDVSTEANATVYQESSSSLAIPGFASASGNFSNSIYWGGVSELKINGQVITDYSVASESGFDYIHGYPAAVPIPAAGWLFGSGLLGLIGVARRKRSGSLQIKS